MKASQFILEQYPEKTTQQEFLQLSRRTSDNKNVSTGPHRVKLLSDEEGERKNYRTQQVEKVIWYHLEENGVEKKYAVPIFDKSGNIHYLIQKLGLLPAGTEVILEYKKKPNSYEGYIDVQEVKEKTDIPLEEAQEEDFDIPDYLPD